MRVCTSVSNSSRLGDSELTDLLSFGMSSLETPKLLKLDIFSPKLRPVLMEEIVADLFLSDGFISFEVRYYF